ncbi:MAG: serine/threonine protein kinase [Planctomycetales bacterium]|nr:serine/threonine protein kinase [Planctomycetales bacterium]
MHLTTMIDDNKTQTFFGDPQPPQNNNDLTLKYQELLRDQQLKWTTYHRFSRQLGAGGQGIVYLSERRGADGFNHPVAIKVFSPERFQDCAAYRCAMERIAAVASRVATIQHDNVLDIHDFVDRDRIRIMVMEWIDGYDIRQLLNPERLTRMRQAVPDPKWQYLESVIATLGPEQVRFKAGVAVAIVRDCLAALAALHRERIVHGDIKPANIMLKRTGHAKLIDMGAAFDIDDPPPSRSCTPTYAAPEVLEGATCTPRSDLASLGYVMIEMLAGRPCFDAQLGYRELLEAKRRLPQRLHELLPPEVACNNLLMNLCKRFIATDPAKRFPSAEAAELREDGAAQFHRQLVFGDLASEYNHDIRVWLDEVRRLDNPGTSSN